MVRVYRAPLPIPVLGFAVVDLGTVTGGSLTPQVLSNITVPLGATIFAFCTGGNFNGNSPVPSDSANGAYTSVGLAFLAGSSVNGSCRLSYFPNSAAINNGTLTFTPNGGSGFGSSMSAFYVTTLGALRAGSPAANTNTGTGSNVTAGISANVGDFVVAGVGDSTTVLATQDPNYTSPFAVNQYVIGGHQSVTSPGTPVYAPANSSSNWGAVIGIWAPH